MTIGRGEGNHVRVNHRSVSREHAILHLDAPLRIQDLGGTNGTFVRDAEAPNDADGTTHGLRNIRGQTVLVSVGDSIDLGRTTITLQRAGTSRLGTSGSGDSLVGGQNVAGRFLLEERLGAGGTGEVWRARDLVTKRLVALKVLNRDRADRTATLRLVREAQASCAVRHPNVRAVYDVLHADSDNPTMIMELLEGETLAARLDREVRLAVPVAAGILRQVCSAVESAHLLGIVHRDLKPANVFLCRGPNATAKVLDFGIARVSPLNADEAEQRLTATGALLGTPLYMAPEQAFGERDVDQRADVWALGMILYESLSGVNPTAGENLGQIIRNIVTRPVPPLREVAPEVPLEIDALTGCMLSRAREQRPSLREVIDTLARHETT